MSTIPALMGGRALEHGLALAVRPRLQSLTAHHTKTRPQRVLWINLPFRQIRWLQDLLFGFGRPALLKTTTALTP